jgi:hypothetical protein
MFKLAERRGGRDGLYCGWDGVYLGPAALIERREGRYWLRAEDEVAALLAAAYETPPDVARFLAGLHQVGAALVKNDLGGAMIAAVQLRVDAISELNEVRVVRIDALMKYNFNPLEPRGWHGRWAGEGSEGMAVPVSARGPSAPRLAINGTHAWEHQPNSDFRNRLAIAEGNADKPNFGYGEVNQKAGALGRYQMTPAALRAAGMIDADGTWTGKFKVQSRAEFLADPDAQEMALTDYLDDTERQLRANCAFGFVGTSVVGIRGTFTLTRAGLIAAAHRAGAPATRSYLDRIANNGFISQTLSLTAKSAPLRPA